ncbi:flagella synthesis protein FlgN [Thauera sedimentorum]
MNQTERLQFAQLIGMEVTQLRTFITLLGREESLLVAGDTDALLALTNEKTELYHTLQRLHDARAMLLGRLGLANSGEAIRSLCADMPDTLAQWDEVLRLAAEARERNSLNGKLVIERMQHNQGALSILLAAADRPQLYDADGHARTTGGGRILGSA